MPTFLETCLCRGRGPSGIAGPRHTSRPDLIAAMLRERDVARFIVASPGFGRSTLAYEYAEMVFGFQHVFWVRGASPCFLRDLDAGILAQGMLRLDADAALAVWEDLPGLSPDRAEAFAAVLDDLLAKGVESVVVCAPSADCYGALQRDRLKLGAPDLLLSDEEMQAEVEAGRLSKRWDAAAGPSARIAAVRWSDRDAAAMLLRGLQTEELPAETWLAMMAMLLLVQGGTDELLAFLSAERAEEALAAIAADYPLFGVDERSGTFCALDAPADAVLDAFSGRLEGLVAASLHSTRTALCEHLADALLDRGMAQRACAFALAASTTKAGAPWLARRGWQLLAAGQAQPFCECHRRVAPRATGLSGRLSAQRAWAAFMMDDEAEALQRAHRIMVSRTASASEQLAAQVLAARMGTLESRDQAVRELERTLAGCRACPPGEGSPASHDFGDWLLLGHVALGLHAGSEAALTAWLEALGEYRRTAFGSPVPAVGVERDPERRASLRRGLLLGAAWLIDEYASGFVPEAGEDGQARLGFDEVARFVRDSLEQEAQGPALGWHAVVAASALERVGSAEPRLAAYLPEAPESALLHRAEVAFFEQQEAYRRSAAARASAQRRESYQVEMPLDPADHPAARASHGHQGPPLLQVRMFGGFEVRLGEALVTSPALDRVKTRLLLQLLVLNRGREVSKERLLQMLWPDSELKRARKNFYSAWSQLTGALAHEGGCPYLVRTRNGCRIDRRTVASDVTEFDKLCRTLLFEAPEDEDWERTYFLVSRDYGEDLLANEAGSPVVADMRLAFRTQLVDGMVAAASRLARRGEARGSLWFAREALRRDANREDVYIALMEAQIMADQRGEALETYFACRRFLSERLGIDPSLRLVQLYRSIIECEEVLA